MFPLFLAPGIVCAGAAVATQWNSADKTSTVALSNGNLTVSCTAAATGPGQFVRANKSHSSGKWYFEVSIGTLPDSWEAPQVGVMNATLDVAIGATAPFAGVDYVTDVAFGIQLQGTPPCTSRFLNVVTGAYNGAVDKLTNAATTWSAGDVFGFAIDLTAGNAWIAKNNAWIGGGDPAAGTGQNNPAPIIGTMFPAVLVRETCVVTAKFTGFTYTPPTGFLAW